jgi:formamidopyrimidine-DNA glycosylase
MLEWPEIITLAAQLEDTVVGRSVDAVYTPTKPHKFCFFYPDVDLIQQKLLDARIDGAKGFGIFVELSFDNGLRLCVNDGVCLRLYKNADAPASYQLLIRLDDGHSLVFSVAMYAGISLHDGSFDNKYYLASKHAISPFSDAFQEEFERKMCESKPSLSAKAFLATEQRFPGIGNGVLQDILFEARIHPKRKISALSDEEKDMLCQSIIRVLQEMIRLGGRDTDKDLFDRPGGYVTSMSKNTVGKPCARCGSFIVKESYMGGSIYYCPGCQK